MKLSEDKNGDLIEPGDTVKDADGYEMIIEYGVFTRLYGFGDVHGYYIPHNCKIIKKHNE